MDRFQKKKTFKTGKQTCESHKSVVNYNFTGKYVSEYGFI